MVLRARPGNQSGEDGWYEIPRAKTPHEAAELWREDTLGIEPEENILVAVTDGAMVWRFWTVGEMAPHYIAVRAGRP